MTAPLVYVKVNKYLKTEKFLVGDLENLQGNALTECYVPKSGVQYYRNVPGLGYVPVEVLPIGFDYFCAYQDVTDSLKKDLLVDLVDESLRCTAKMVCYHPAQDVQYYQHAPGVGMMEVAVLSVGARYFVRV